MTSKQRLAELKEKIKALKDEVKKEAANAFKEVSQEIFEQHPILVSFSWDQYTPYFNDGEPCNFRANTGDPKLVFLVDGEEVEMEAYDVPRGYDYIDNKRVPIKLTGVAKEQSIASRAVIEFLDAFDDDDLEEMFGDNLTITVRKNGVDTNEYDHD